ncbi:MAG: MFS transporter [Chloroflexota bacterium]
MATTKTPETIDESSVPIATGEDVEVALGGTSDIDEDGYNRRGAYTMAGAHLSHDVYTSFRDPLIPIVQEKLGISLFLASLMVPAQQMPSLLQPFIGRVADRTSKRWFVVLAPAVAGISVSSIGLAPHVAVVLLLLFVAGLASAAFHTPAVALAGEYGGSKMGKSMALFQAGGSLARAVGPLMATGAVALLTFEGIWAVMVVGIAASVALYFTVDTTASDEASRARDVVPFMPLFRARMRYVIALLGYGLLWSMGRAPFTIFLVAYLLDVGRGNWYAGISLASISFAGMFGSFFGGILSDRVGRKAILGSSAITLPPVLYTYLFVENGSIWVIGLLCLAGIISMASNPVELALAQEIMPEARGTMAGIALAFRFSVMSLIALGFGAFADTIGIQNAFWFIPVFPLIALLILPFLPRRGQKLPDPVVA